MAKECMLSIGKLPLGSLPRNSMVKITDRPGMTSAVYHGSKATKQTYKESYDPKLPINHIVKTLIKPDGCQS